MKPIRITARLIPPVLLLGLAACSSVPAETEEARGILEGVPLVLALSVLLVVAAVGLVGAILLVERTIRSRNQLIASETEAVEDPEPTDEIVAGITVGRAAVPRWLYGVYVLIPVFAFAYVFSNIAPAPSEEGPDETPAPSGPCTECEVVAAQILFDTELIEVVPDTEVSITMDNQDVGVPHNVYIWEDAAAAQAGGEPIAQTAATVPGGAVDSVEFTSPAAGTTWYFNCTIHPASMFGDVVAVAE